MNTIKIQRTTLIALFIVLYACLELTSSCPTECDCNMVGGSIRVNCSNRGLVSLPLDLETIDVNWLDLSGNNFAEIPRELNQLKSLDRLYLNNNMIRSLSQDNLEGFDSLRILQLKQNNISNWADINPGTAFTHATSLTDLYLNDNPFGHLPSAEENLYLSSQSLERLHLAKCRITKISSGDFLIQLPKLTTLILEHNPLQQVPEIVSASLTTLNLKNTRLGTMQPNVFEHLPMLTAVDLSRNHRITLVTKTGAVTSDAVQEINLSYCNLNEIELNGFSELLSVYLKGNLIRELDSDSFAANTKLVSIDLSSNAISAMTVDTFKTLKNLKYINLSYNMLIKVERDTFKYNDVLSSINLSRNYIARFNKMFVRSLSELNMSGCEIMSIDPDALKGFPEISELDLSNNLISVFPETLSSNSLQALDLSMCRITAIRNLTFQNFPELSKLVLSGNRLTVPPHRDFFATNDYLRELYLGDNPWRCDCTDEEQQEFYNYFMEPYKRIIDRDLTKCIAPEDLYGQTWESACMMTWHPSTRYLSTTERVWTFIMVSIIVFCGSICVIMSIKRCIAGRKKTRREEERERTAEEHRQITRENRMRMDQQAQLNAPDPRESCPPCYEEAILLPRLDGSFSSLNEISTRRKARKLKEHEDENGSEPIPLRQQCRCRSEEVLSMRESVRGDPSNRRSSKIRNSTLPPIPPMAIISQDPRNAAREEQIRNSERNSTHYHATDILQLNHVNERNSNPPPPLHIPTFTNQNGSPYSPRRTTPFSSFNSNSPRETLLPRPPSSHNSDDDSENDHYRRSPYSRRRMSQRTTGNGAENIYHSPVEVHAAPK